MRNNSFTLFDKVFSTLTFSIEIYVQCTLTLSDLIDTSTKYTSLIPAIILFDFTWKCGQCEITVIHVISYADIVK